MEHKILTEWDEGVLTITLNHPSKLNCMGFEMLRQLEKIIDDATADQRVSVLLFRGAGDRAFSTGADLKEFGQLSDDEADEWIESGNRLFNKIESFSKPTLAWIQGYALGGGFELALSCDFRLGTDSAVMGFPELMHGWLPGWGGMTRLRRLIGEVKAKELIFTSKQLNAREALGLGLLNAIAIGEDDASLQELLETLKSLKPGMVKLAKSALMDPGRTTTGADILFDCMAVRAARSE